MRRAHTVKSLGPEIQLITAGVTLINEDHYACIPTLQLATVVAVAGKEQLKGCCSICCIETV